MEKVYFKRKIDEQLEHEKDRIFVAIQANFLLKMIEINQISTASFNQISDKEYCFMLQRYCNFFIPASLAKENAGYMVKKAFLFADVVFLLYFCRPKSFLLCISQL